MKWDLKQFFLYRINTIFSFKFLKKPVTWIFVVLIGTNLLLWRSNLSPKLKLVIFISAMIVSMILNEVSVYRTGEHTGWWRDKLGIPSKAEIKKLKESQNEKDTTNDRIEESGKSANSVVEN